MTDTSPACCRNCACYLPDPVQLGMGLCRCLPPAPIAINQNGQMAVAATFPPVPAGGYCFQWRPPAVVAPANDPVSTPPLEPQHGP